MNSIRRRLTKSIVGGLVVLAVASGVAFYFFARWMFVRQFDGALLAKAEALATLVEQDGPQKYEMEFTGEQMPEFVSSASMQYFQVWLPNGQVLRRSPNLKDMDLPQFAEESAGMVVENLKLPGGEAGRAVRYDFTPNTDDNRPALGPGGDPAAKATVVLARDRRELDQVLTVLLLITLVGAVAIPLLAAVVVSAGVRKGLRPVVGLAGEMEKIDSPAMAARLDEKDYPEELRPVVLQLNSLMDRLNGAFLRERRFTMDASHELRTPLAEAGTALEVAGNWPDDHGLMMEANRDALQAIRHMEVMVTALLALARGEEGLVNVRKENVDLGLLVGEVWGRLEEKAEARDVALQFNGRDDGVSVVADRVLLTSVIQNLLDNAIEYSVRGGEVVVMVDGGGVGESGYEEVEGLVAAAHGRMVKLSISNRMESPLGRAEVESMFEPFWRKDKARRSGKEEDTGHSGLGLALVSTLCRAMDMEVGARVDDGGVLVMELGAPAARAAARRENVRS